MRNFLKLFLLLFLITAAHSAIKKGPYLILPGPNTQMTVLWQLSTTETATLQWGTDLTYSVGSVQTTEYGNDHQHKYTITNLTPDTKYYYKVTIASGSYTGTFAAAPQNQDVGNLKFLAYGDTRSNPSIQNSVTGSMIDLYESDPAYQTLCLLSGDYISTDGEANWGDHYFGRNYANNVNFLENIPVMGAIGNHEGSGTYFKKYYPYPHVSSFYFSFDYGPLHVVCVDQFRASYSPGSAQYNWLENDLASTTKEWKVIVLHAPGWSAGGGHSNNTSVQNYLQPLCKQYGVDIVFGGDNHYYSRAVVDGVQHITTGGGGAPLYSPSSSYPNIVKTGGGNHFCKINIQGYDLSLVAITPSGTVYDSFSIKHTPPIPPSVATDPNPQDGVLGVGINTDVSWSAGSGASSHDVYFGTANPLPLVGNQSATVYDPGALQPATTYYWRVDEKNSIGTTQGNTWSFTTTEPIPPLVPVNLAPQDNAINIPVNASIAWNVAEGADSYDVYFGTSSPAAFQGNQTGTTFSPASNLSYNSTYYWSVKAVNEFGVAAGEEWSFTTETAPPHNDVLAVTDGYDQKNGKTLVQDGKLRDVTSSNNSDIEIEKDGYYQTLEFGNISFPQNVTIHSVKVFVEHSEESGYSSGNLRWDVGTGWPNSSTVWETVASVPTHTSDQVDSWDLTGVVTTPEMVNDLELKITNNDMNSKVFIDYAYVQVEWKEGTATLPGKAQNPNPMHTEIDVPLSATLDWIAGQDATAHDVYFGTTNPGTFQGTQNSTGFNPGTLSPSTTYYWHIDEKNAAGTTNGDVWSFTTVTPIQYNLVVDVIGDGSVSIDPASIGGVYDEGTVVTLVATANSGSQFDLWSGSSTSANDTITIVMDGNKNVTANFSVIPVPTYTLTANVSGDGSVSLDPQPVNGKYEEGTVVTLTASANAGSQFDNWSGSVTGATNPVTITMNGDKNITAAFSLIPVPTYTLTANVTGNGSVTLDPQPVNGRYEEGTVVTVTASANSGSQFDGWSGSVTGATNPVTITMNGDKNITAAFSLIPVPTYTLTANVSGNGSVTLDPQPVNGRYEEGTVVTVTASANSGSQFDGWSGSVTGATNPVTITMNGDKNITAAFSLIPVPTYTLTANVTGNGSVTLDPQPVNGRYEEGTVVTVTASANSGSQFDGWSGSVTGATNLVTITMNGDKNITAAFSLIPVPTYTLTANVSGNGSVTLDPQPVNGKYEEGTVVTVTASPNAGSQFDNWSGAATGTVNPVTITMDGNKTVTANFSIISGGICDGVKEWSSSDGWWTYSVGDKRANANQLWNCVNPSYAYYEPSGPVGHYGWNKIGDCGTVVDRYSLSVNVIGNGNVTLSPAGGTYDAGTVVTLTAAAYNGSQFDGWSGDASGTSNSITIIMDGNKSITGNFSLIPVTDYTLTVNVIGNGAVSLDPVGGVYPEGTVVTITAIADNGSQFDGWSGAASGAANPVTITMTGNKSVTGNFSIIPVIPQYSLTVDLIGDGSGSVTPAGGIFDSGTVVTITASADAGSQFNGWSGDVSGSSNPIDIVMNGNKNITGSFSIISIPEYTLSINTVGQGSVTLDPVGGVYPEGTIVTITATADAGSQFDGWSGDLSGTTNPNTITITKNSSVTATFVTGGGICDGVNEWNANDGWWSYSIGDLRTNANQLWRCINSTYSYLEPSSSSGRYGWEKVGDCN